MDFKTILHADDQKVHPRPNHGPVPAGQQAPVLPALQTDPSTLQPVTPSPQTHSSPTFHRNNSQSPYVLGPGHQYANPPTPSNSYGRPSALSAVPPSPSAPTSASSASLQHILHPSPSGSHVNTPRPLDVHSPSTFTRPSPQPLELQSPSTFTRPSPQPLVERKRSDMTIPPSPIPPSPIIPSPIYQTKREQTMSVSPKTVPEQLPQRDEAIEPTPERVSQLSKKCMLFRANLFQSSSKGTQSFSSEPTTAVKRSRDTASIDSGSPPAKKVRQTVEIPIWARQAKKTRPLKKYQTGKGNHQANSRATPTRTLQSAADVAGGHCFNNRMPSEDVTHAVCDFLFLHVVTNEALTAGPDGRALGVFEIEGRVGSLIKKGEDDRLLLPVRSETVLNESLDVAFESNMTLVSFVLHITSRLTQCNRSSIILSMKH